MTSIRDTIQPDLLARFLSDPYFQYVNIFAVRERSIASEVADALKGVKRTNNADPTGKNAGGKSGMTMEILEPTIIRADENPSGIIAVLELKTLFKENRTVNLGINGTGIPVDQFSTRYIQTMQISQSGYLRLTWVPGQPLEERFYIQDEPIFGYTVKFLCGITFEPIQQPATVQISGTSAAISMTCATAGVTIYYTADGTYPGAQFGSTAKAYAGSFAAPVNTIIRAVATLAGAAASPDTIFTPLT